MRIKIKVVTLGHMPPELNLSKLIKWNSDIFQLLDEIENFKISEKSDGKNWCYTDEKINNDIPDLECDFLVAIVTVPLEKNYYVRNLKNNKVVVTIHEIRESLSKENIPLINIILRTIYARILLYKRFNKSIPLSENGVVYTHDDTRGCIFDMNGHKEEIIYSTNKPILCDFCTNKLKESKVSSQIIDVIKKEIKGIEKYLFFRVFDFIKKRPIISLIISSASAVVLGILASVIASFIYESLKYSSCT